MSRRSERGSILILVAISMVALLSVAALSVDASFMYDLRNRMAAVADDSATSGAWEVKRGNAANLDAFVTAEVDRAKTAHLIPNGVTIEASRQCNEVGATCTSPYNTARYVEVILADTHPTFFGTIMGWTSLTPRARAVAGFAQSVDCWVVFNDLTTKNNDHVTLDGCGVSVGHDISLGNNSYIHADAVGYSHACNGCGDVTPTPAQSPVPADPLSMLTPPPDTGPVDSNCPNPKPISGNITLNGGHYCGWRFTDKGNTLTLNAGIYYITGPISTSNPGRDANIVGTGVMIYLAPGASIDLDANHVSMTLSGYNADPYSGILFYQDRANTNDADFAKNNGDFTLSGASYFPSANLTIKNNLGWTGDCVLFVAKGLELKNNANISNDCGAFAGGTPLQSIALAE